MLMGLKKGLQSPVGTSGDPDLTSVGRTSPVLHSWEP